MRDCRGVFVLFDFETATLRQDWHIDGRGHASRATCAVGSCLHVTPKPGMRLVTIGLREDFRAVGALSMRVWSEQPTTVEVWLTDAERGAGYRQSLHLFGDECLDVALPLGWFRRAEGPPPSWSGVDRLELRFRGSAEVWLDDIALHEGSPALSPEQIAAVTGGRVFRGRHTAVITTVDALDGDALVRWLDGAADRALVELPWLRAPEGLAPLVVLPSREAFLGAVQQIAARFGGVVDPPKAGGFTLGGIAMSSWDAEQGSLRPVYVHEIVHALLERGAGLPNEGEWLQEGLASLYQAKLAPQANLGAVVRERVAHGAPLDRLCDGRPIGFDDYGAALAVAGVLVEDKRWAGTLRRVVEQSQAVGSTSLLSLGIDLDALEASRRQWAENLP